MNTKDQNNFSAPLPLPPERVRQGDYYLYRFSLLRYDVHLAAIHCLKWYVASVNQEMDSARCRLLLTHTECLLCLRIRKSEWEDSERRDLLLKAAGKRIQEVKATLTLLSEGEVPLSLKEQMLTEFTSLSKEW